MIADKNILKLENRRKIYFIIKKNPGLHLREISRRADIPKTTTQHHIKHLKKLKLIEEKSEENHLYYYLSNDMGVREKQIIKLLRKKVPANIYLCLCFYLSCSQIEISKELELPPQTISRYLKKMLELGIIVEVPFEDGYIRPFPDDPKVSQAAVEKDRKTREIFYRRNGPEIYGLLYKMILTHKDSIFTDKKIIDAYMEYYEKLDELNFRNIKDKKIRYYRKKTIDGKEGEKRTIKIIPNLNGFLNTFEDTIFKPPFCA